MLLFYDAHYGPGGPYEAFKAKAKNNDSLREKFMARRSFGSHVFGRLDLFGVHRLLI